MLKSLSTQFFATLLLGPLGLAYSSMAAAVFLTLLLAVLVFSELGLYAFFLIWPLAIVTGMVFVKLHNDGIRQSGSRLLLGPGESPSLVSTIGSWARAVSVMALIAIAGYIAFLYLPQGADGGQKLGRIVDAGGLATEGVREDLVAMSNSSDSRGASVVSEMVQEPAQQELPGEVPASILSQASDDGFAVIALPKRDVTAVIIGNGESSGLAASATSAQGVVFVSAAVVNLRQGPGVSFPIVTQVERGDKLVEYARDGQWINVETEDNGATGWIYSQLVSPNADP